MTAIFIKGLRILKRIQDVAYATISTKALEITQLQQATIKVFLNQLFPWMMQSCLLLKQRS